MAILSSDVHSVNIPEITCLSHKTGCTRGDRTSDRVLSTRYTSNRLIDCHAGRNQYLVHFPSAGQKTLVTLSESNRSAIRFGSIAVKTASARLGALTTILTSSVTL